MQLMSARSLTSLPKIILHLSAQELKINPVDPIPPDLFNIPSMVEESGAGSTIYSRRQSKLITDQAFQDLHRTQTVIRPPP